MKLSIRRKTELRWVMLTNNPNSGLYGFHRTKEAIPH